MDKNNDKKSDEGAENPFDKLGKEASEDQIIDSALGDALFDIETGGVSYTDPTMTPEMKEAFQNQIRAFEEQMKYVEPVTMRELLGKPDIPDFEDVGQDGPVAIRRETERLIERVKQAGFMIDRPEPMTDDGTWYRFLTEMMLSHEVIPFTSPEGITQTVRHLGFDEIIGASFGETMVATEAFLVSLLLIDESFDANLLADEVQLKGENVPKARALEYIDAWRKQFSSLVPLNFGKLNDAPDLPPVEGSDAIPQMFGVAYEVTYPDGHKELLDGPGVCLLLEDTETGEFQVVGASLPGFEL